MAQAASEVGEAILIGRRVLASGPSVTCSKWLASTRAVSRPAMLPPMTTA
ncbi:MAG: hypothetical protein M3257_05095 [Actinomycetota bacterium]|nr:hypothetical protein [Actinomycetota bacterium]